MHSGKYYKLYIVYFLSCTVFFGSHFDLPRRQSRRQRKIRPRRDRSCDHGSEQQMDTEYERSVNADNNSVLLATEEEDSFRS